MLSETHPWTWRMLRMSIRVTTRERGVIPGCIPMDIHEYKTHEGAEVCAYPPKQDRTYTTKPASSFLIDLRREE